MDKRTRLVRERAQEIFETLHPDVTWLEPSDRPNTQEMKRQAHCLTLAEDQLIKERLIESVDQEGTDHST